MLADTGAESAVQRIENAVLPLAHQNLSAHTPLIKRVDPHPLKIGDVEGFCPLRPKPLILEGWFPPRCGREHHSLKIYLSLEGVLPICEVWPFSCQTGGNGKGIGFFPSAHKIRNCVLLVLLSLAEPKTQHVADAEQGLLV